ncbi:MAG: RagB/SusD family nutrient uptake outer membrane protein [Bacteroidales bacterium]
MKYLKFFIVALLGVSLVACHDKLDVVPSDSLADGNAFETINDYEMGVLGVYQAMRADSYYGGFFMIVPDVLSDNLLICKDGRTTWRAFHEWTANSTTFGTAGFWGSAYVGINNANQVISRLQNNNPFEVGTPAHSRSLNLLGEALALRAMLHFDLVRVYGEAYINASSNGLGIPYMHAPAVGEPARHNTAEVYQFIRQDLEAALELYNGNNNNARLNARAIPALMARVALYMEDWQNAHDYAMMAVAGDGSDITGPNLFNDIWRVNSGPGIDTEVIFRIAITNSDPELLGNVYGQGQSNTAGTSDGNRPEYVPSFSYYQLFEDNDMRKHAYFMTGTYSGTQYNSVSKFFGRFDSPAVNKTDAIIIRTPEMYLTAAEALYRLGQYDEALTMLDLLRAKRYVQFESGNETGIALINEIYKQRRLELGMEGHRFFDLKRKGLGVERDDFGDEYNGEGLPANARSLEANHARFLLPIPQGEINSNSNMVQNPGYSQ